MKTSRKCMGKLLRHDSNVFEEQVTYPRQRNMVAMRWACHPCKNVLELVNYYFVFLLSQPNKNTQNKDKTRCTKVILFLKICGFCSRKWALIVQIKILTKTYPKVDDRNFANFRKKKKITAMYEQVSQERALKNIFVVRVTYIFR